MPEFSIVQSLPLPKAPPAQDSSSGAGGFDPTPAEQSMLAEIRRRESSGNYGARNLESTASGAYQFVNSTWKLASQMTGVPKYATAAEAPKDVQDANALYMLRNYGPDAKITWAASGPYRTPKGSAARSEAGADTTPAPPAPLTTPSAAPGSMAEDLLSRIAGGENIEVTPQVIAQILQDRPAPQPAPAPEAAKFSVVQSLPLPAAMSEKPPEPSPVVKAGKAFAEGLGIPTLIDLLGGASRDPVRAQRAQQAATNVILGIANEPARMGGEMVETAKSLWNIPGRITAGDWMGALGGLSGAAYHAAGVVPFLGAPAQQIAQDIARGDPAAAVGHTGALIAPFVAGPVAGAVGRGAETGATFARGAIPPALKAAVQRPPYGAALLGEMLGGPKGAAVAAAIAKTPGVIQAGITGGRAALDAAATAAAERAAAEAAAQAATRKAADAALARGAQVYQAGEAARSPKVMSPEEAGQVFPDILQPEARPQTPETSPPPSGATPAQPVMSRAERRATAMPPETGVPESVARAMAEREALIGKPPEQWTNADVLAADALRAEGYTGGPARTTTITPAEAAESRRIVEKVHAMGKQMLPEEFPSQPGTPPAAAAPTAPATVTPSAAPQTAPAAFETAQGSQYTIDGGSTTRFKTPHFGHEPTDVGLKTPSARTVYVDPQLAKEVGMWNTSSGRGKRIIVNPDNTITLVSDSGTGRLGRDRTVASAKFSLTPEVGKSPLELFEPDANGRYRGNHPGNPITRFLNPEEVRPELRGKQPPAETIPEALRGKPEALDIAQQLQAETAKSGTAPAGTTPAPAAARTPESLSYAQQLRDMLEGKPTAEETARAAKVDKLSQYLIDKKIPLQMIDQFGDTEWKMVAREAGVNPPGSKESIAGIRARVADYESAATMPPENVPAKAQAEFQTRRAKRTRTDLLPR